MSGLVIGTPYRSRWQVVAPQVCTPEALRASICPSGLYVRRKGANNFEVRELMGGKSSIAFSYRIVGRRKDIKQPRRFAKVDMPLPPPTRPGRAPRKPTPSAAGLRAFIARVEKEARERAPKGAEKAIALMRTKRA